MRRSARLAGRAVDAAVSAVATAVESARPPKRRRVAAHTGGAREPAVSQSESDPITPPSTAPSSPITFRHGTVSRDFERALVDEGFTVLCGVDEAGRGPLAGPVVTAACLVPLDVIIDGVNDSKLLTEAQREHLYAAITSHPSIRYSVRVVSVETIDKINILQATLGGMTECIDELHSHSPLSLALIDGPIPPPALTVPHRCVVKGDSQCFAIAAASIIAKVTRDRLMLEYDREFPHYQFARHKGYGVAAHLAAIKQYGPCRIHRTTFAPIKHMLRVQ